MQTNQLVTSIVIEVGNVAKAKQIVECLTAWHLKATVCVGFRAGAVSIETTVDRSRNAIDLFNEASNLVK